jgi:hypothetical protein
LRVIFLGTFSIIFRERHPKHETSKRWFCSASLEAGIRIPAFRYAGWDDSTNGVEFGDESLDILRNQETVGNGKAKVFVSIGI